jgi:phosphohistidine phosphatase
MADGRWPMLAAIGYQPSAICYLPFAMRLYFVRHGFAQWPNWTGNDADRPLTREGVRLIHQACVGLAHRLKQDDARPDFILHSPLVRAFETAEIIATELDLLERLKPVPLLQPGFNFKALQALLSEYANAQDLMLVGHNPDMAEVVSQLIGRPVNFKEGTIAHVKLNEPDHGSLVWLGTAEELASS